jgi:hypothetical protein
MSATPDELSRLNSNLQSQFTAADLQLAGLHVRAKIMLDGADQAMLRACIDAYIAANGLDVVSVNNATLAILRRMQAVEYLNSLPG